MGIIGYLTRLTKGFGKWFLENKFSDITLVQFRVEIETFCQYHGYAPMTIMVSHFSRKKNT